ncbi:MAG: redoxin domain-containing protein, partial [Planctomycetaceae bacterium]|nr:redoxin domain-containing protein [Planctomycetaceae bacterium]
SLQSLEIASPYVKKESVTALSKQLPSVQTINHYRYRLDNSDISVSPKDRFFRRGWQAERGPQEALEGKTPPPLTVDRWRNIDGDSLSLDDLKGKVVLVYFWREPISWCRMQMLAVNALYEKYHDQGLEIIGVHSTEDADNLQFYVAKHDIHWPVCADVGSQTNTTWHVQFNSGHYLLDRNGTLRYADLFQGHLEEAVKALLAEAGPVDVSALEPPQIPLNIVIAKHVMLLEGREIVTWDEVEKKIAELPDPSLAYPHLYETRGARESGTFEESEKTFWGIREKYKLKGHSVGSLWPRTDWRYDQIESAKDLVPDESLRVEGSVVDAEGKPVADAEVILVTPVDESISYKSYHIALVEGRVRNPLEHVLTHSDDKGAFSIYPPPDTNYSIIALHPDHGFTLIRETSLVNDHRVTLLPWGGIVAELSEEPEQQVADLSTRISESDGRPEVVISQYWSDLKQEKPTLTFGFTHVPPIFDTTISRSFPNKDGGSTSVPGASVGLLPGETRRLDLGPLTKQQRERIEGTRKLMEQRQKQAEEPNDETSQISEPWKVRLKAIDQATGEVISRAKFEVEQLYEESEKNTRTDYSAEDDGAFVAEFETRTPDVCVLSCRAEGYTPVHGRWISPELSEEGEPLPEEVIFHMEKGVTVGGIVLNEDEEPVAGAKVLFSASNYDVAPGEKLVQTFSKDEFVTDEDGRWSCNYAPEQMTETLITVNHEDYSVDDTNYGIGKRVDELKSQQLVYYLRRPRTVYGQVTDLDGEPIESALITVGVYPEQDDPTFRTDAQGCYSIEGILVDRITVIKPGFAPSEHIFSDWPPHPFQREIDDGTAAQGELNFQLQPGVTVEIHVTDKEGKQLENANVTPTYWETSSEFRGNRIFYTKIGQQFLPDKTDEDGLWSWTWAPRDDQLKFVVSHSGYVTVHNVPFTVDKTSQTFNVELETDPSQPQILVGLVFDAETKQPIESFKVQRGYTSKNRLARPLEPERYGEGWVDWRPTSYIPGKDGRFLTNITVPFGKGKHVYRVLADGYETAIGEPVMNDDGDPVLNFELERRP